MSRVEVLQGGRDMEIPPTSERPTTDRCNNVRGPVRNDIRLDGEWKHQRLRRETSRCRPAWACRFSIRNVATLTLVTITKSFSSQALLRA